jgi:hypothetical protein
VAPRLIEAINEEQSDVAVEMCSEALAALGPPVVPLLAEGLRDKDATRQLCVCDALRMIGTEECAKAIVDWIDDGGFPDELALSAIKRAASPVALPLLESAPQDAEAAQAAIVICAANSIDHPSLPKWQTTLREAESRRGLPPLAASLPGEAAAFLAQPASRQKRAGGPGKRQKTNRRAQIRASRRKRKGRKGKRRKKR